MSDRTRVLIAEDDREVVELVRVTLWRPTSELPLRASSLHRRRRTTALPRAATKAASVP